jgi:hypothetical protein
MPFTEKMFLYHTVQLVGRFDDLLSCSRSVPLLLSARDKVCKLLENAPMMVGEPDWTIPIATSFDILSRVEKHELVKTIIDIEINRSTHSDKWSKLRLYFI